MMLMLNKSQIKYVLGDMPKGRLSDIHIFERLDSTNTWLLEHKQCGALCLAENQSAGRGRQGRQWVSQATGNIYCSYCYCFDELPQDFSLTTLVVGVAICDALEEIGLQGHGLKWPNDIYIKNKKLGGILVETAGMLQQVVIGIGLNIALDKFARVDQPWCSLSGFFDEPVDRNRLIGLIVANIVKQLGKLQQGDSENFKIKWQQWDILRNKTVNVIQGLETLQGVVAGIDPMGQIGIKLSTGDLKYFNSAEIKIRW